MRLLIRWHGRFWLRGLLCFRCDEGLHLGEQPRLDVFELVPALHHVGRRYLRVRREASVGVHADLDRECPAELPADAEKQNGTRLLIAHQSLHLLTKVIEVEPWLFKLIDFDMHAIEVLVNVGERPLGQVKDRLDTEHP